MDFYINDTIAVGKRLNNSKRNYLLINRFQAKHIPSSPKNTFQMLDEFASLIKSKIKEDNILIIGFAETATAISMHVASFFQKSFYIQTTREYPGVYLDFLVFSESHSHATEQKIATKEMAKIINDVSSILIIDDEISTGNTVVHLIDKLGEQFNLSNKKLYVASLLNRPGSLNIEAFEQKKITNISLMSEDQRDFDYLNNYRYHEPKVLDSLIDVTNAESIKCRIKKNPRFGFYINDYFSSLNQQTDYIFNKINIIGNKVVVIGTEEFMYQAITLAKKIESSTDYKVKCHSTTRSPISICDDVNYPIFNGYVLHSAYEKDRITYLYNIEQYDTAIIVTDSESDKSLFFSDIVSIFKSHGVQKIIFVEVDYDK